MTIGLSVAIPITAFLAIFYAIYALYRHRIANYFRERRTRTAPTTKPGRGLVAALGLSSPFAGSIREPELGGESKPPRSPAVTTVPPGATPELQQLRQAHAELSARLAQEELLAKLGTESPRTAEPAGSGRVRHNIKELEGSGLGPGRSSNRLLRSRQNIVD